MKKTKRRYRNPKILVTGFMLMGLFIGELLFYTWCRVQSVQIKYEISQETQRHQNLAALRDNLKIELAHLKSPQRIATIAKNQLGLIKPTPKHMIPIP
ncbi:MAG: cell division protein FtsL [Desulfobacterales bacterium]|jgi:cell division protein FtsB|nr:MAG: cell division protein FtsL [Desulfobacterales bacterium]